MESCCGLRRQIFSTTISPMDQGRGAGQGVEAEQPSLHRWTQEERALVRFILCTDLFPREPLQLAFACCLSLCEWLLLSPWPFARVVAACQSYVNELSSATIATSDVYAQRLSLKLELRLGCPVVF